MDKRDSLGRFINGSQVNLGRKRAQWEIDKVSKSLKGRTSPNKGKKMSEEQKKKISISHTGLKYGPRKPITEETRLKMRLAKLGTGKLIGIERRCDEYKIWRKIVLEKYNFTCQKCGVYGGKLHSHHIKSFCDFKSLRFLIINGIIFCNKCHRLFHNIYGNKNAGLREVKEFLLIN